jgi:hypothetical protein
MADLCRGLGQEMVGISGALLNAVSARFNSVKLSTDYVPHLSQVGWIADGAQRSSCTRNAVALCFYMIIIMYYGGHSG